METSATLSLCVFWEGSKTNYFRFPESKVELDEIILLYTSIE